MTTPYIGSKISLISKAKIRYEGTLYGIDTDESTVSLSDVRSFGTEDRDVERRIPPQDGVYPCVVFRGDEIVDLQVSQPPVGSTVESSTSYTDPAIVSSSKVNAPRLPQPAAASATMPMSQYGPAGYNTLGMYSGMPPMVPSHGFLFEPMAATSNSGQLPRPVFDATSKVASTVALTASTTTASIVTSSPSSEAPGTDVTNDISSRSNANDMNAVESTSDQVTTTTARATVKAETNVEGKQKQSENVNVTEDSKEDRKGNKSRQQQGYTRRQHSGGHRPRGNFNYNNRSRQGPSKPLNFKEDFDFEKANARFDKERLEQELSDKLEQGLNVKDSSDEGASSSTPSTPTNNPASYDKSKSFFDTISCEANQKKTSPWKGNSEGKTSNVETFGINSFNTGRYHRGRGRGRGAFYRNRGGNYNNRGGGNYNNRGGGNYNNRGGGNYNTRGRYQNKHPNSNFHHNNQKNMDSRVIQEFISQNLLTTKCIKFQAKEDN